MIRDIVVYPDKRLKMISKPVERFDEELHTLLDDMYETMIAKNGVGLAAIQVGVPLRVLIINVPVETDSEDPREQQPRENTLEVINPVILEAEGKTRYQEGCLSVPGYFEEVDRYKEVRIEYQDRHGKKFIIEKLTVDAMKVIGVLTIPGGGSWPIDLDVPSFEIEEIGKKEKGVLLAEVVVIVLDGLFAMFYVAIDF